MSKRKIVKIDEERCTGCGLCIPNCAEGALKIINGKAALVKEIYCDGLGACLGHCPEGAITIEERESAAFNEEETKKLPCCFGLNQIVGEALKLSGRKIPVKEITIGIRGNVK